MPDGKKELATAHVAVKPRIDWGGLRQDLLELVKKVDELAEEDEQN